tara:strand:- start:698 stop:1255 length:558 start_codon:yes stop_codon:yes gene_type:complete
MAVLSDIYKTRNNREMVLTPFQADIFEATLDKFKLDGVGGDDIIEETYVLQKAIAEFITSNMAKGGGTGEVAVRAVEVYNNILGIETSSVTTPVEVVKNDKVVKRPLKDKLSKFEPAGGSVKNVKFRDLRPADRPFRPSSMAEVLKMRPDLVKTNPMTKSRDAVISRVKSKQRSLLSKLGFGTAQ